MSQREIERIFELLKLPVASDPVAPNAGAVEPQSAARRQVVFFAAESTSIVRDPEIHAKLERDPQRDQGGR